MLEQLIGSSRERETGDDLGPLPRLRFDFKLTTNRKSAFAHSAQTQSISLGRKLYLGDIEAAPIVANFQSDGILHIAQFHTDLPCESVADGVGYRLDRYAITRRFTFGICPLEI